MLMASRLDKVRFRLSATLCRIFANAILEEAARRSTGYAIGTYNVDRSAGWADVAEWLMAQAAEFESRANQKREPRF